MKIAGRIDRRGMTRVFAAPATEPGDVHARLDWAERALFASENTCRPLAVEVERVFVSTETGIVRDPPPEPTVLLFADHGVPEHVAITTTTAHQPKVQRLALDAHGLRRVLDAHVGAKSADVISDWRRIEVIACHARAAVESDTLVLSELSAKPVRARANERGSWIAGPIDAEGWRRFPPIGLRLEAEGGVVHAEVTAFWSPWIEAGRKEREYFDQLAGNLVAIGFKPIV